MKFNFKYKVPYVEDDEATNIAGVKATIASILESQKIPASTKAAIFEDLNTRYRNYVSSLDTPPVVQIKSPELGVVELPKEGRLERFSRLYDSLRTNDAQEAVLGGVHPLKGSNIDDLLKYAASRALKQKKPAGYDEFYEFAKDYANIRKPFIPEVVPAAKKPLKKPTKKTPKKQPTPIPRVTVERPIKKQRFDDYLTEDDDETYQTPRTSKRRVGRGKSLVIRLWKR